MNYQDNVEYTPEGFQKAVDSLDFLPEEARMPMMVWLINMFNA